MQVRPSYSSTSGAWPALHLLVTLTRHTLPLPAPDRTTESHKYIMARANLKHPETHLGEDSLYSQERYNPPKYGRAIYLQPDGRRLRHWRTHHKYSGEGACGHVFGTAQTGRTWGIYDLTCAHGYCYGA